MSLGQTQRGTRPEELVHTPCTTVWDKQNFKAAKVFCSPQSCGYQTCLSIPREDSRLSAFSHKTCSLELCAPKAHMPWMRDPSKCWRASPDSCLNPTCRALDLCHVVSFQPNNIRLYHILVCIYIYIDTTRYDYNRLYSTKCDCLPHPHSPGESRERLYICAPFYCFGEGRLLQGKPGEECQANATHEWFWNQQEEKIESNPLSPSVWCQPFSSFLGCPEVVGTIYT